MELDAVLQPVYIFTLAVVELLINLVCVPVSAINFLLIVKTSVIHPNLKHILLYQSACILGRGMCRFTACFLKFVLLSPMASEYFEPIGTVYSFFVFNRNSLVHVLIIERVLATLMVKSYERKRKPYFALGWLAVLLSLSLYNSISYRMKELSILLTNVALLSSAAIELYLFSLLRKYSSRAYKQSLKSTEGHHLSERYQLSENVRIGKQLIPTLVVHPLNIMSSTLTTSWNFFGIPGTDYVMVSCATFSSFCSLLIEISIIICHPFLKRDFDHLMNSFIFRSRISENVAADSVTRIAMTNILSGERLVTGQRQEEHFEMLRELWN